MLGIDCSQKKLCPIAESACWSLIGIQSQELINQIKCQSIANEMLPVMYAPYVKRKIFNHIISNWKSCEFYAYLSPLASHQFHFVEKIQKFNFCSNFCSDGSAKFINQGQLLLFVFSPHDRRCRPQLCHYTANTPHVYCPVVLSSSG